MSPKLKTPLLLIAALLMILAMLRLGVWQLDRAASKSAILEKQQTKAAQSPQILTDLITDLAANDQSALSHRFTPVLAQGKYAPEASIFIDNQVHKGQVGYQVFTPLQLADSDAVILVNRGWVSVGESRAVLPIIDTPPSLQYLRGRLNTAPAQPPFWDDDFPVFQDQVWAYLPVDLYNEQFELKTLPLVLELAPDAAGSQLKIAWADINDEWVAKHKGYAFQWFAMAFAFLIACLVLLIRRKAKTEA